MTRRSTTRALLALLLAAMAPLHAAAAYPDHAIHIVVPLSAGGNVDLVARLFAQSMSKDLAQAVIVDNRPGASSSIGTAFVARAPSDGYTILAIGNTFLSAPALLPGLPYDPMKQFIPLARTVSMPMVLDVPAGSPYSSLGELLAWIRAHPGKAANGTAGIGSTSHFAGEQFASLARVDILEVPYKGNADALTGVMGGQVTMMFDSLGSSAPLIKSGRLKALGVTTKTRSAAFPSIPTIAEAGLPGYEDATFNGLVMRSGTPPEIVERLFAEVTKVMADPAFVKALHERGIEPAPSGSPAEFGTFLKASSDKYVALVRERHMRPQ